MTRYLNLYWYFLIQRLKVLMEYRASFILGASSTIAWQASSIAAVWVVMQKVPTLNGWNYDEVLLVYGLVTLSKSINHMFADNLWTLGRVYIRSGGFDRFLVRPIDPLFHLLADRFCQDGVGNFLVGLALLVKSSIALGIDWTPAKLLMLIVGVASGGFIFIALNLITCVTAFWIVDSVPVTRLLFDNHLFAQYPLSIYPKVIGILLTWIIIAYPPCTVILRTATRKKSVETTHIPRIHKIWTHQTRGASARGVIPVSRPSGTASACANGMLRTIVRNHSGIITSGTSAPLRKKVIPSMSTPNPQISEVKGLDLPDGAELLSTKDHKVQVRFDRTVSSASKVAAMVMNQIEVRDFSLSEPELSDIVKQIYNGALEREAR